MASDDYCIAGIAAGALGIPPQIARGRSGSWAGYVGGVYMATSWVDTYTFSEYELGFPTAKKVARALRLPWDIALPLFTSQWDDDLLAWYRKTDRREAMILALDRALVEAHRRRNAGKARP